ncbi:hypothetical protein EDB85DRAFT_1894478 [Lactarius pseudohatsudake]|nr:hypothetical protein EDB85DRAFT_1894478 [Lactarius pseudohatsudake]
MSSLTVVLNRHRRHWDGHDRLLSSCLGQERWWFVVVVVLNVEHGKPPWPVGSNLFHARSPCAPPTTNYDYDHTPQLRRRSFELHELQPSPSTLPMQPQLLHQQQQWGKATTATEPQQANARQLQRLGNACQPQ